MTELRWGAAERKAKLNFATVMIHPVLMCEVVEDVNLRWGAAERKAKLNFATVMIHPVLMCEVVEDVNLNLS